MTSRRGPAVGVIFCNGKYNLSFQRVKLNILPLTEKNAVICKALVSPAALVKTVEGIYIYIYIYITTGLHSRIFGCKSNRRKTSTI